MKISALLLTTSLIAIAGTASATGTNKYYTSITGEYIANAKADGDISARDETATISADYKNGWGGLAALGYNITPDFRAEIEGGYRELKAERFSITNGETTYTASSNAKKKAFTAMGNVYYDIPTDTNFTPYIGAGIGWAHETSDASNAFAYQGMLGLNYKVAANNTIFAGYRYIATTDFTNDYTISNVQVREKASIQGSAIDVGYRFNF